MADSGSEQQQLDDSGLNQETVGHLDMRVESGNQNPRRSIFSRIRGVLGGGDKTLPRPEMNPQPDKGKKTGSPGMSRREFLKWLGLGLGVEITTGAVSKSLIKQGEQFLALSNTVYDSLGIENYHTRFAEVCLRLKNQVLENSSNENARDTLAAWVKFNGAVVYGRLSGMEMAADMVEHFLYGNGQTKDVTEALARNVDSMWESMDQKELAKMGIDAIPETSQERNGAFIQAMLGKETPINQLFRSYGPYLASISDGEVQQFFTEKDNLPIGKEVSVFAVNWINIRALQNSIGAFTLAVKGRLKDSQGSKMWLTDASAYIRDRYDWANSAEFGESVLLGQVLDQLGVAGFFEDPMFNNLKSTKLEILDKDGHLLMNCGLANAFEVFARLQIAKDLELNLGPLELPPEE